MPNTTILTLLSERIHACREAGLLPPSSESRVKPFERIATESLIPACCAVITSLNESGVEAFLVADMDCSVPFVGLGLRRPLVRLVFRPLPNPEWLQISTTMEDEVGLHQTEGRAFPASRLSPSLQEVLIQRLDTIFTAYRWMQYGRMNKK